MKSYLPSKDLALLLRVMSLVLWGKCEHDPAMGYELMKRFSQIMLQRLEATRLQLLDLYGKANHL